MPQTQRCATSGQNGPRFARHAVKKGSPHAHLNFLLAASTNGRWRFRLKGRRAMSRNLVPLVPMAQSTDRDAEIDQIKRELEILRVRYAFYCRMGRILKLFCVTIIPLFAIGALVLAIKLIQSDTRSGVLFIAVGLLFGAIIWLIGSSDLRWIDLASGQFRGIYDPYFFYPDIDLHERRRSDAELIEQQIADRERRLSDLEKSVPGSNKLN